MIWFHNMPEPDMQHNLQPEPNRRRLSLEIPGLYNMSCTEILALANNTDAYGTRSSVGASSSSLSSQYSMDSLINSWRMESNPLFLNPGSSLGINTGIPGQRTMPTQQYDVSTRQRFLCDLYRTPEEMVSTSLRPTEAEFPPITLKRPARRLAETDQEPHDPIKKSILETGSRAGVKRGRPRNNEKGQLKTPAPKKKKTRPKVVGEGKTNTASSSKPRAKNSSAAAAPPPAATATKTSEETSYVRPKRSSGRFLRLDFDIQDEEEEYCGLDFPSEGHARGEGPTDRTLVIFSSIPKGRRKRRTNAFKRKQRINPSSSEQGNDGLSSMLSPVNTGPATLEESEQEIPSESHISQSLGRKRSSIVTRPRNVRSLSKLIKSTVANKRGRKLHNHHVRPPQVKANRRGRPPQVKAIVDVSPIQTKVFKKKQSPRDPTASQINPRVLDLQWRRQSPQGTSFVDMWERSSTIDAITKLLEELDINIEGLCLPHNRETALILSRKTYEEQQALVKYSEKQKPKVQLDPETNRVSKLLKLSIDSDGVDGADEKTRKWWKNERNVFFGRTSSFSARMSRVQGDRTFSPWKGSVVDSVVGVFLTQNVTDHSSSSAYMDLAATFPLDRNFNKGSSHEEWGSSVTHETMLNPRIRNPSCIIIEEIHDDEDDTNAVYSQGSYSSISSTNQSTMMLLDPFNTGLVNEQVDSQMVKGKGHIPNTSGLSMVSYTSSHFDLNELPPKEENWDSFTNNDSEESQVQHMSRHQHELESTLHAQDQEQNTRTEDVKKKKPTTSRPVGRPRKNKVDESSSKKKAKEPAKSKPNDTFDWDSLRKEVESGGKKRERTERTRDTVDWEAVRCADVNKIANIIIKRGFNNLLAGRIKAFLNRLVEDHGSIDLEWLRDVPPDKAKEYLLSINGLGLKSVECVRLLSLHQVAFPVDTNVGRIAVRLGWVPLQPLPDELQMHLLEQYPVLDSVQRYLWPRLCKLDQKTLYELHYHMITFGKVFCTKIEPNCNACPMKAECRHYASAQSARLALPEPEASDRTTVMLHERRHQRKPFVVNFQPSLLLSQGKEQEVQRSGNCFPIIEEPASPEPEYTMHDIEDYPWGNNRVLNSKFLENDPWASQEMIPTIMLNKEAGSSTELVVLSAKAAAIPTHQLKTKERLRTEHLVYELPDYHPILERFERREAEDIFPYLLAIWTPGETVNSIQPPKQRCDFQGNSNTLCHEKKCFQCNKIREEESQIVRGTILIPCRTAMRGGFPLNGTYFQTNEVFADHASSINPIHVPREHIWKLPKSLAYFGSSVSIICRGLTLDSIRDNFEKGYVCVRGFDRKNRTSKTLVRRLHCAPINQEPKTQEKKPRKQGNKPKKQGKKQLQNSSINIELDIGFMG